MSKEDKFTNHPSLTVVKEDDFCEGKAVGYGNKRTRNHTVL